MHHVERHLLPAIHDLAATLPQGVTETLATAIAGVPPGQWQVLQHHALAVLPHPRYRDRVNKLLARWQTETPQLAPQSVALALQAAAHSVATIRSEQTLELVWTGPPSTLPLRRTDQVLLQVIDEAKQSLMIVSFAVYNIDAIVHALVRAINRGVRVYLIIESAQASAGKLAYDSLAAFGVDVAARAHVFRWPLEERPTDNDGKHGSLHAKCAVADERTLLISSANLTHYALTLNMEMGVLVRGGALPSQVKQHFLRLIDAGVLTPVLSHT